MYEEEKTQENPFLRRDEEDTKVEINAIPNRGLKVAASAVSLLRATDEEAFSAYNSIMGNAPGDIPRVLQDQLNHVRENFQNDYSRALVPLLSDSNIPMDVKARAVTNVRNGSTMPPDGIEALVAESLVQPSQGESHSAESVRSTLIDRLDAVNKGLRDIQEIENNVRGDQGGHTRHLFELMEMFLPGEAGITAGRVAKGLYNDTGKTAAAALLPGTARKQISDAVANMPIEQRVEFVKQLAPIVQASSGLLTNKNQLRISSWLSEVAAGGVTASDEWMDNIFNVLDIVGVGSALKAIPNARKAVVSSFNASREAKMARERAALTRVDPTLAEAPTNAPQGLIPGVTGNAQVTPPRVGTNVDKLEAAEAEYSVLLSETSGRLDNGVIAKLNEEKKLLEKSLAQGTLSQAQLRQPGVATRALERRQDIQAQIARIDEQIAGNANAARADQRLAQLDTEIATLRKDTSTVPAELNPVAALYRRTELNSIVGFSNPRSPMTVLENTNPAKAKALHAQIYFQSDDFAEAVSGGTKNEALMRGVLPQVADGTGTVKKVVDDKEELIRSVLISQAGVDVRNGFSGFAFTEKELAMARDAKQINEYENVSGLKLNDAMSSFGTSADGVKFKIDAVYTKGDGGWLRAEDAVSQAKVALRKQGVRDSDIEVLRRDGGEYTPVKLDEVVGKDGDYAIRIKMEDDISAYDVKDWDSLDVKRNIFDFIETNGSNTWGSIQRHVMEAASTLHKQITGSASIADDKAARLSKHFTEEFTSKFSNPYVALPKKRRDAVDVYLKEANLREIAFDPTALATRFNDAEINVIRGWRDAWDQMWVFENYDLIKSLNRDGFLLYDHPNLRVALRERPKRYDNRVVYDPASDTVKRLTDSEIDDIYAKGGNIAESRSAIDIGGKEYNLVVVRNQGNEVARKFRDNDQMLNYREGYYQVQYRNPRFVERVKADGTRQMVGVVGSAAEAKRVTERLQKGDPASTYSHRGDDRNIQREAGSNYWDLQHSAGRLAQRHRGQLLADSVGTKQLGKLDFIETPAESATRAAHSIGGRLAMRETLEVMKQRFLSQYADVLGKDEFGQPAFPANRGDIHQKGAISTKQLADARSTWEYIRSIESGYVNALDVAVKNSLNAVADLAGMKGYDTTEKVLRAGADTNITGAIKGTVFASFLATNPLRMWIIQPTASLRMFGYNPSGFLSGRVQKQIMDVTQARIRGVALGKESQDFFDWFRRTGVEQAITRGNLVRGTLLEAADRTTTMGRTKDATVGSLRKIGYDGAESFNLLVHGAAIFDRYKQAGKNITDRRVMDEMHMELRSATRNMNLAGDMPYNQNILALLFTYMQVPHKFLLQPFDRQLSRADRARLVAADLAFFGLPISLISQVVDANLLPENDWMRQFIEDGLSSIALNGAASLITGERQGVDTSTLNPYGLDSWNAMFEAMMFDGGVKKMIENTPTARVFGLGTDSRLGLAIQTTSKWMTGLSDNEGAWGRVELSDVARSWLGISSGFSNMEKARAAWMLGKMRDKTGRITDDSVTGYEAFWQMLGMGTRDTVSFYEAMKVNMKDADEQAKDDVKSLTQIINHVSRSDPTSEKAARMLNQIHADASWMPSETYRRRYLFQYEQELKKSANDKTREKLWGLINRPEKIGNSAFITGAENLSGEQREELMGEFNRIQQSLEEYNKAAEAETKRK